MKIKLVLTYPEARELLESGEAEVTVLESSGNPNPNPQPDGTGGYTYEYNHKTYCHVMAGSEATANLIRASLKEWGEVTSEGKFPCFLADDLTYDQVLEALNQVPVA